MSKASGPALTYESLSIEVAELTSFLETTQSELERMRNLAAVTIASKDANDFDMDMYLVESNRKEAETSLLKLQAKEEDLVVRLKRSQALLKIATPALPSLVKAPTTGKLNPAVTVESSSGSTGSTERHPEKDAGKNSLSADSIATKRPRPEDQLSTAQNSNDAQSFLEFLKTNSGKLALPDEPVPNAEVMPPVQQKPKIKPAGQSLKCEKSHEMPLTPWTLGGSIGVYADGWVCGMCNKDSSSQPEAWSAERYCCAECESDCCFDCVIAWRHSRSGSSASSKKQKVLCPTMPINSNSDSNIIPAQHSFDMLEGGESVWVPPKNQKGDGKTHLNERFGY
jgi:hypothetical protein